MSVDKVVVPYNLLIPDNLSSTGQIPGAFLRSHFRLAFGNPLLSRR